MPPLQESVVFPLARAPQPQADLSLGAGLHDGEAPRHFHGTLYPGGPLVSLSLLGPLNFVLFLQKQPFQRTHIVAGPLSLQDHKAEP